MLIIKYKQEEDKQELLEIIKAMKDLAKKQRSIELLDSLYNAIFMAKEETSVKDKLHRISEANKIESGERTQMPELIREIIANKQYGGIE